MSNGGFIPTNFFLLIPAINSANNIPYVGLFDVTSFDDQMDGCSYTYRKEDISVDRVPTVRRVAVQYRDLGLVTVTFTLKGTNDDLKIVTNSVTVKLGNILPTKDIFTYFVDVTLTAFRPQLTVSRAARGGPLSIISVTLIGEVEEVSH